MYLCVQLVICAFYTSHWVHTCCMQILIAQSAQSLTQSKKVISNNCLDLIFQIHHIAEASFYTNLEKVIFIMINGKPFWYFISKYWRPQMHKRQKDVRDKKILSITYHCSSFPLPPFHSYIRSAIKRCCMKPYIMLLWSLHQLSKGLMGEAARSAPSWLHRSL